MDNLRIVKKQFAERCVRARKLSIHSTGQGIEDKHGYLVPRLGFAMLLSAVIAGSKLWSPAL